MARQDISIGTAPASAPVAAAGMTAYQVSGMTCGHCAGAVTEEVRRLPGVTGVSVDLIPGGLSTVTVAATGPLDVDAVRQAVAEAGYELAGERT
jgi:copper chaperone